MSRWANRKTTLAYAQDIVRAGSSEKVMIDREGLRQLVKLAESRSARSSAPEARDAS